MPRDDLWAKKSSSIRPYEGLKLKELQHEEVKLAHAGMQGGEFGEAEANSKN